MSYSLAARVSRRAVTTLALVAVLVLTAGCLTNVAFADLIACTIGV